MHRLYVKLKAVNGRSERHLLQSRQFLHYAFKDFNYWSYSFLNELSGNTFSWNSAGLFFSMNYLYPIALELQNISQYFIARGLIEKKDIGEAIEFLNKADCASGFHFFIGNCVTEEIVSVEKTPYDLSVKRVESLFGHTNHYIHPRFIGSVKGGIDYVEESMERLQIVEELMDERISLSDAENIFGTTLYRPRKEKDTSITQATVVANLKTKKIFITL